MTVKKIQYEDCEEVGLQHAWEYYLPSNEGYASGGVLVGGSYQPPTWAVEEALPDLVNTDKVIAKRDCKNCSKKEQLHQIHIEEWEEREDGEQK